MSALDLAGIWTGYNKGEAVLKDVDVRVDEGEIVSIVGPNGAGKTTLLRMICGLLPVWRGGLQIWGQSMRNEPSYRRAGRGVALVPEGARIFVDLSVRENLAMGAYLRKDKDDIGRDYEVVYSLFPQLKDRLDVKAGGLSGGQRQMLAIGRGLMSHARLLLLDEPSLGLAPLLVDGVFRTLLTMREMGTTLLIVEQNAVKALEVAERAYVLSEGSVVASGSTKDLAQDKTIVDSYFGISVPAVPEQAKVGSHERT
jgi:branched-chain amino acid transport system ATP-binding protein